MPVLLDTERKITDGGLAQVSSGLLPIGTVLLSSRAPIGYLAIAEVPVAVNQGFIAMKPRHGTSNLFLLRWAGAAHDEIVSHANGSTFLEISKAGFRPIRVAAPTGPVMEAFDRQSRPLYRKVVKQERETEPSPRCATCCFQNSSPARYGSGARSDFRQGTSNGIRDSVRRICDVWRPSGGSRWHGAHRRAG